MMRRKDQRYSWDEMKVKVDDMERKVARQLGVNIAIWVVLMVLLVLAILEKLG